MTIATGWWLVFFTAGGLAVGSYLNVVIYRIPRGLSTTAPAWSFCPRCGAPIHWFDNLPVLSYVRLGGRCRACGGAISPRYPAVELLMATVTLVLLDGFCVAGLREGPRPWDLGLTEQLSHDWPILLAHVILFACLLAMSAIDLEHYFIDIRFTNFAVLAGLVLHTLWTPAVTAWVPTVAAGWYRPGPAQAAVGVAVVVLLSLTRLATWLLSRECATALPAVAPGETHGAPSALPSEAERSGVEQMNDATAEVVEIPPESPAESRGASAAPWLVAGTFLWVAGCVAVDAVAAGARAFPTWRALLPILAGFLLIVGAGAPCRRSDTAIVEAIEAERSSARRVVLRELLGLMPAVLGGLAVAWLCLTNDTFHEWWATLLDGRPWGWWRPVLGLATAACGYVIAGALGWAVRIGFTLLLGREAFGTGDIHLMAAAGCIAGWPVVVMGFVLTSFLALLGWVVTLPFKRTRAIPLVPWLSLAFLIVTVFYDVLRQLGPVRNAVELWQLLCA